jgi:hypothetical protein
MTDAPNIDPIFATLPDDIAALKEDVASLIGHLKLGATKGAQSAAKDLDQGVHRLSRKASAPGDRSAEAIGERLEQHPLAALLIALGVGYAAGRLLSR